MRLTLPGFESTLKDPGFMISPTEFILVPLNAFFIKESLLYKILMLGDCLRLGGTVDGFGFRKGEDMFSASFFVVGDFDEVLSFVAFVKVSKMLCS